MSAHTIVLEQYKSLKNKLIESYDENVASCYQCGKCTAGCPLSEEFDYSPNQLLRLIQYGNQDFDNDVLESYGIWLCLSCETCYARCPKEVNLPEITDFIRAESIRQNKVNPKAKNILAFHKTFLESVEKFGRLFEVGLVSGYKLKTMNLFQDVNIAPTMYLKGKLKLFPHKIKNIEQIRKMFKKSAEIDGGKK